VKTLESIQDTFFSKSGVRVKINKTGYAFYPPVVNLDQETSDEDYIRAAKSKYPDMSEFPPEKLSALGKQLLENQHVGGIGITHRSLAGLETYIPEISRVLQTCTGKVGFFGNGLAFEPVQVVIDRFKKGEVSSPPVVVDLFDYHLFYEDLLRLEEVVKKMGKAFPFQLELDFLNKLTQEADAGNLILSSPYRFGTDGDLPPELGNCDVVVSALGPPTPTLPDQVRTLSANGQLYFVSKDIQVGTYDGFIVEKNIPTPQAETSNAWVIRQR